MRIITLCIAFFCFTGLTFAGGDQRPNILFLLADDHRPDAVGAFNNPHIKTPHIDSLAKSGFRWRGEKMLSLLLTGSSGKQLQTGFERVMLYMLDIPNPSCCK